MSDNSYLTLCLKRSCFLFLFFSCVLHLLWVVVSVQVNTTPQGSSLSSLLVGVWPRGPHRARLLSLPPISPAARQTVSSTIKGCAVMKGALAEAIYFPAQRRKVSVVLIFQRRLCVPYSAIMGGMRRTHPAWTNALKGEKGGRASKQKTIIHRSLKITSYLNFFFLQCTCHFFPSPCEFPSFSIYILFVLLTLFSCWVFLFACSCLPPLPLSPLPCAPTPTYTTLLSVIPVFILFLWSLLN